MFTASMAAWPSGVEPRLRLAVNASVVDDRVHAADRINLFCDALGFAAAAEITDDQSGGT